MIDALAAGLSPLEIGQLSLPELRRQFKASHQRMREWYELGAFIAWHAAAWSRGKLPKFDEVMAKMRPPVAETPQDPREVRAHFQALREMQQGKRKSRTVRE